MLGTRAVLVHYHLDEAPQWASRRGESTCSLTAFTARISNEAMVSPRAPRSCKDIHMIDRLAHHRRETLTGVRCHGCHLDATHTLIQYSTLFIVATATITTIDAKSK
jgi:hypothetical protein